jgi:hypothetical protein
VPTLSIRGAKGLQAKLEAPGALEAALLCRRLATLRDDVSADVSHTLLYSERALMCTALTGNAA